MDSIQSFDQTKENIQPLAQGRKTLQFEAALHAQNNPEANQELNKIAENYELGLRTYEGEDSLALWYEYICWVEQSFPKGGKEGNLCSLLEKCLTHFKDNKTYFQDGRLVRLWIKYIDGSYEGKRAELYKLAHGHGVGTQSALFYRFWAYELERSGDHKNADKIYQMGLDHNAEPREELINAHRNFQATIAQMFLNGTAPSPQRPDASDRKVLAALRANSKNHVPNVRLGGAIHARQDRRPMSLAGNQVQQPAIKIFNDDGENLDSNFPRESMRSLPKNSVVNKENSQSAGPWTGPPRRKTQPAPSAVGPSSRPAFQVHTDDVVTTPREPPRGSVMNALKPIKDEFDSVPYAIFDDPNPNQRCMYPKDEVYAGGMEFSLEELRAARWMKKEATRIAHLKQEQEAAEQARLLAEDEERNAIALLKISHVASNDSLPSRSNTESDSLGALQLSESKKDALSQQSSTAKKLSFDGPKNASQKNVRRKTMIFLNGHNESSEIQPQGESMQEHANVNRDGKLHPRDLSRLSTNERLRELSVLPNESCSSTEPSMLHSQSITVNTKEAMSVMNELWGSTCDRGQQSRVSARMSAHDDKTYVVQSSTLYEESEDVHDVDIPVLPRPTIPAFSIFSDCESQSNAFRLTQSEYSINAKEDESHTKENMAYNRRTLIDEEDEYVVPNPVGNIKQGFVIYQETDDGRQQDEVVSNKKSVVEIQNEFVIYEEIDEAQLNYVDISAPPITDSMKSNFLVYQEEEEDDDYLDHLTPWPKPPFPGGIPLVPSPGMTPGQVLALQGTEHKENVTIEPPPENERPMAGILQPSIGIPFQPIEDTDPEEAAENFAEPTEFYTQACTQAFFNFPLTSSTPFHGNMDKMSPVEELTEPSPANDANAVQETGASQRPTEDQVACLPARTPTAPGPMNLSVIMENSKENYRSSSSSGSSCGTNTRRTFSVSTWSAQESMQRTGREKSLAAIRELEQESLIEAEDYLGELAKERVETDGFSLRAYRSVQTEAVDFVNGVCKEDLFTVGVFDLTSRKGVQASVDNDVKCSESITFVEERDVTKSGGSHRNLLTSQSFKQIEMSFHKLELSQKEPEPAESAKHLKNESQVNASNVRMKIFEDSLLDDIPNNFESLPEAAGESIDPFDEALVASLLNDINFPGTEEKHFRLARPMPVHWKPGSCVQMGSKAWEIAGMLGKGSYAKVVKGLLKSENQCRKPEVHALKIQKPSWVWELYISCQIHKRLDDPALAPAFMKVDEFYEFNNGSVFSCEYIEYGTILSVANKLHSPANIMKSMIEPIAMHFTIELLKIVEALHKCRIIHADVKPDNFLLRSLLTKEQYTPTLQLIDYGRAIDMTLFREGTSFKRVVNTKGFTCVEMQSDKPWTYQTDLYGMASTAHCLLLGEYMNTVCRDGVWNITKKLARGFKSVKLWQGFFHSMLNIKSCENMPDLVDLRANFEKELDRKRIASSVGAFKNLVLEN